MLLRLKTYWRLGLINIARVAAYRLGLRLGLHPVVRIRADIRGDKFFKRPTQLSSLKPRSAWKDEALYFGWYRVPLQGNPPAWFVNPFNEKTVDAQKIPWWKLSDFNLEVGDIKTVWEVSRFDWVLPLAQRAKTGCASSLQRLNFWLSDWCRVNPAYYGPNWKCGQEASIRVMHLTVAALILGQDKFPERDLVNLVEAHLARIYPTLSYAVAQDNNHGTSEAAALFIGGNWCKRNGVKEGRRWATAGRKYLENRVMQLIEPDGSFSQYSLNYHRLMLDTLSIVEVWRRRLFLPAFSRKWQARAEAAAKWLRSFIDPVSGGGPNLGSNDGARLLPLTDADYRDYRPSVQLASALFENGRAYANDGHWNVPLDWLEIKPPDGILPREGSRVYGYGGYALLRNGPAQVLVRFPRFRFRPSHADGLHLDFWLNGKNILRDGGSYSYGGEGFWRGYFPGTMSHNTIQFDDRDQMPRLSRFLFGDWLQTERRTDLVDTEGGTFFGASYKDRLGTKHKREVLLRPGELDVTDTITGFRDRAVLRWRLIPGKWVLRDQTVELGELCLTVASERQFQRVALMEGWESRYYLQKTPLPVLEVELSEPGVIVSKMEWKT